MRIIILSNARQLRVRDAIISDAPAMHDHFNQVSTESDNLPFGEGEFGKSIEDVAKHIESCITKDNAMYAIAEVDGKLAGYISFEGGWRPRNRHIGEFGIAIKKEFWGSGIGSSLIQHLIDWAKQGGIITKINLKVKSDNTPAIKLYEKLGFRYEGKIIKDTFIDGTYYDVNCMGIDI